MYCTWWATYKGVRMIHWDSWMGIPEQFLVHCTYACYTGQGFAMNPIPADSGVSTSASYTLQRCFQCISPTHPQSHVPPVLHTPSPVHPSFVCPSSPQPAPAPPYVLWCPNTWHPTTDTPQPTYQHCAALALLPHPSTPHHATPHFCKCGPCTRGCLQVGKTTGQQNLYRWVWVCQVQVGVAFLEPLPNPYPCMGTPKFFQQIMFRLDHDQCHCQMPLDQSISILISTLVLNFSKPAFWSLRL